jgi:Lon protease-like protein
MHLPPDVPVMTLSNVILFPQAMLPLHIFEPRYRQMLQDVLANDRCFAVAMRRPDRRRETPAQVAGLGLVRACVTRRDGTSNLILQGVARISLGRAIQYRPYRRHAVLPLLPTGDASVAVQALTLRVLELVQERLKTGLQLAIKAVGEEPGGTPFTIEAFNQALQHLAKLEDSEQLADLVSATLLRDARQRQLILETPGLEDRLRHLVHFLQDEPDDPDLDAEL